MNKEEYWKKRCLLAEELVEGVAAPSVATFGSRISDVINITTEADDLRSTLDKLGIKYDYSLAIMDATATFADNIRITNALKVGKAVFYFDMGKYVGIG